MPPRPKRTNGEIFRRSTGIIVIDAFHIECPHCDASYEELDEEAYLQLPGTLYCPSCGTAFHRPKRTLNVQRKRTDMSIPSGYERTTWEELRTGTVFSFYRVVEETPIPYDILTKAGSDQFCDRQGRVWTLDTYRDHIAMRINPVILEPILQVLPRGYRKAPKNLKVGREVYIWQTHMGQPRAGGPFIYLGTDGVGYPQLKRAGRFARVFRNPWDDMLIKEAVSNDD